MRRAVFGAIFVCSISIHPAAAQFVGKLEFKPKNCQVKGGICTIVHDFGFIDSNGVGWQAKAGLKTDGASIPDWAQPIVGGQFDASFIKAAVIHDHYCVRHVRNFLETHRVFYDALIASGVDAIKANAMYYAILVGGPKWIKLITGEPCSGVGHSCVRSVRGKPDLPEGKLVRGEGGDRFVWRDAIYDRPDIRTEMQDGARIIEQRNIRDPSETLALAKERRANDRFLHSRPAVFFEPAAQKRQ